MKFKKETGNNYTRLYDFTIKGKKLIWKNFIKLLTNVFFVKKLVSIIKDYSYYENYFFECPMINRMNVDTNKFEFVIQEISLIM